MSQNANHPAIVEAEIAAILDSVERAERAALETLEWVRDAKLRLRCLPQPKESEETCAT
jgi:hypothetical protein